jgi:recombination protein RecT
MCRSLINAISTTPQLAQCSPASLFLSSVRSFSLGLEPNGALSEAYLVPYWNSKKACNEAQFMPSYRGLQNLARRSGEIAEIYSKTVKENDVFDVEEGTERKSSTNRTTPKIAAEQYAFTPYSKPKTAIPTLKS